MEEFVKQIKNKNFRQGEKLETEALIVAQKLLNKIGLDFIPDTYIKFMHQFNGVKFEESYLLGATVEDDLDIYDKNEQMEKPEATILLGFNEFDLLVYNYLNKTYQIVDRDDLSVLDEYEENDLGYALSEIFKL